MEILDPKSCSFLSGSENKSNSGSMSEYGNSNTAIASIFDENAMHPHSILGNEMGPVGPITFDRFYKYIGAEKRENV